jgi:hypothetical protein
MIRKEDIMEDETSDKIRDAVIEALIVAKEAQVRALHQLRKKPKERVSRKRVGLSQLDLVEDILERSGKALHIKEVIDRVEKSHGIRLDRESVVSSLTKKVARGERFVRTEKNTFGLKGRDQ